MMPIKVPPDDSSEDFEVTEALYDHILVFENNILPIVYDQDFEQHVSFDPSRYPDCLHGSMYQYMSFYLFLLGLEAIIASIKKRNWDNILTVSSLESWIRFCHLSITK